MNFSLMHALACIALIGAALFRRRGALAMMAAPAASVGRRDHPLRRAQADAGDLPRADFPPRRLFWFDLLLTVWGARIADKSGIRYSKPASSPFLRFLAPFCG
ncbi:MAG: hypothetical protein ABIS50_10175 [Luteolibacter sp.]|uniref:hypothetical protein n=1 Tax=Luteolibacter sp. TaxID=1962973 RepID=UPI003265FCB0